MDNCFLITEARTVSHDCGPQLVAVPIDAKRILEWERRERQAKSLEASGGPDLASWSDPTPIWFDTNTPDEKAAEQRHDEFLKSLEDGFAILNAAELERDYPGIHEALGRDDPSYRTDGSGEFAPFNGAIEWSAYTNGFLMVSSPVELAAVRTAFEEKTGEKLAVFHREYTLDELAAMSNDEIQDLAYDEERGDVEIVVTDMEESVLREAWLDLDDRLLPPEGIYETLKQGFVGMNERSHLAMYTDLRINHGLDMMIDLRASDPRP